MNALNHTWIGTSNVVVPGNKSTFPESFQLKSRLHYYSSIFNTVEVNSCFYKTHLFSTFEKWSLDVPAGFRFSLKLTKDITHAKDLLGDLACVDTFLRSAGGIGSKEGCLLIQFPGKITLDYFGKVEEILDELQQLDPLQKWRKAVEFRHASWYCGEAYELLDEYNAAMVLHDISKANNLNDSPGNAPFIYLRLHGPKGDYRGAYSEDFLQRKAGQIKEWVKQAKDVYVYFNNTIGSAYDNAIHLKNLLIT